MKRNQIIFIGVPLAFGIVFCGIWLNNKRIESKEYIYVIEGIKMENDILKNHGNTVEVEKLRTEILSMNPSSKNEKNLQEDLVRLTEIESEQIVHPILSIGSTLSLPDLFKKIESDTYMATHRKLVLPKEIS